MKTIMLAYDGDPATRNALERAATLSKGLGARLIVTSVVPLQMGGVRGGGPIDSVDGVSEHARELGEARSYLEAQGIEAEYIEATGEPANAIVTMADEHGAEMVVVGSHGRNLIERMFGQSVSDTVAHKSHVDVLIVH